MEGRTSHRSQPLLVDEAVCPHFGGTSLGFRETLTPTFQYAARPWDRLIQPTACGKDPERRFQSMSDVKVELADLREESESGSLSAASPAALRSRSGRWWWAAALLSVLAAVSLGHSREVPSYERRCQGQIPPSQGREAFLIHDI